MVNNFQCSILNILRLRWKLLDLYILNVVRSAIFVNNSPGYSIQFPLTVRRTRIGSSFDGFTLTTIREYVTVHPTGIFLRATKQIVFVPFWTFPGNPSTNPQNYFDSPFFQRSIVFILLTALNLCILVSPLFMGPQLSWLGTRVTIHIKLVFPCYASLLELLGSCDSPLLCYKRHIS